MQHVNYLTFHGCFHAFKNQFTLFWLLLPLLQIVRYQLTTLKPSSKCYCCTSKSFQARCINHKRKKHWIKNIKLPFCNNCLFIWTSKKVSGVVWREPIHFIEFHCIQDVLKLHKFHTLNTASEKCGMNNRIPWEVIENSILLWK